MARYVNDARYKAANKTLDLPPQEFKVTRTPPRLPYPSAAEQLRARRQRYFQDEATTVERVAEAFKQGRKSRAFKQAFKVATAAGRMTVNPLVEYSLNYAVQTLSPDSELGEVLLNGWTLKRECPPIGVREPYVQTSGVALETAPIVNNCYAGQSVVGNPWGTHVPANHNFIHRFGRQLTGPARYNSMRTYWRSVTGTTAPPAKFTLSEIPEAHLSPAMRQVALGPTIGPVKYAPPYSIPALQVNYGHGSRGRVPVKTQYHDELPPMRKWKEKKISITGGKLGMLEDLYGVLTEADDMADVFVKSFPKGHKCKKAEGLHNKWICIAENIHDIDPVKFVKELIKDQIEDAAIGKIGSLTKKGTIRARETGYYRGGRGLGSGPVSRGVRAPRVTLNK